MNSRRLRGVLLALLLWFGALAIEPAKAQKVAPVPFEPGEELIYKAEVSRSLLKKVDVATFRFLVERGADKVVNPGGTTSANNSSLASYALKFTGDVSSEGFFVKL